MTAQGSYVLRREQAYFDRTVANIFGFNAFQLGLPERDFLRRSRMPLRRCAGNEDGVGVRVLADELPFATESVDLLLLPHVLEFALHPHQILREAQRVLMPEGSLLISGFNPLSLWGMRRALGSKQDYPWCGSFIALRRLKDWLALLGFVVVGGQFAAYAPPLHLRSSLQRCRFMEAAGDRWWAVSGGIYFLHAVKRVPGMRLIQPKWSKQAVPNLLPVTPKMNQKKLHSKNE